MRKPTPSDLPFDARPLPPPRPSEHQANEDRSDQRVDDHGPDDDPEERGSELGDGRLLLETEGAHNDPALWVKAPGDAGGEEDACPKNIGALPGLFMGSTISLVKERVERAGGEGGSEGLGRNGLR